MGLLFSKERVDTENGILAVANFVESGKKKPTSLQKLLPTPIDSYEVYLPSYLNETVVGYAEYLLNHPHPAVNLHYSKANLDGG